MTPAALGVPGVAESCRNALGQATAAGVRVVRGREAVGRHLLQTQRAARRELLVLDKPPHSLSTAQSQHLLERELLARGVRYRVIYDRATLDAPEKMRMVRSLVAAGEECRVLAGVPMKLIVADRSVAVLHLLAENETVLVQSSAPLEGLVTLFELLWAQATPLPSTSPSPNGEAPGLLSADDRHLLSLAAAGLTDHAVARKLGVAQRTVERRMRRIMDRLGARTRFQAGLQAALRGALGPQQVPLPAQAEGSDRRTRR